MPNKDGTGPEGQGSGTGKKQGKCYSDSNNTKPGRGMGKQNKQGNKGQGKNQRGQQ